MGEEYSPRTLCLKPFYGSQQQIENFFVGCGDIEHVELEGENAYVTFYDMRSFLKAFQLSDQVLNGFVVKLQFTYFDKDKDYKDTIFIKKFGQSSGWDNDTLKQIFSNWGDVKRVYDGPNPDIHKLIQFFDVRSVKSNLPINIKLPYNTLEVSRAFLRDKNFKKKNRRSRSRSRSDEKKNKRSRSRSRSESPQNKKSKKKEKLAKYLSKILKSIS
jgi:hypothetical protein